MRQAHDRKRTGGPASSLLQEEARRLTEVNEQRKSGRRCTHARIRARQSALNGLCMRAVRQDYGRARASNNASSRLPEKARQLANINERRECARDRAQTTLAVPTTRRVQAMWQDHGCGRGSSHASSRLSEEPRFRDYKNLCGEHYCPPHSTKPNCPQLPCPGFSYRSTISPSDPRTTGNTPIFAELGVRRAFREQTPQHPSLTGAREESNQPRDPAPSASRRHCSHVQPRLSYPTFSEQLFFI